ncbi:hypothetical protein Pcinc_029225 [Petrolisthes cinctipes]|uniref:Uncharacterized protein n=1 Tax=Petrolisthes cinctipes TaxID=88211 RepID=A0AAE1K670_PETCI|nr:hypothetical protein Pcinc_029225 [Petrolisthes cinctipes]
MWIWRVGTWITPPGELKKWEPRPTVTEKAGQPGEMGKPVRTPAGQEALMKEKFKLNQFNPPRLRLHQPQPITSRRQT